MRPTMYVAAALALVAFAPETMRSFLVCAASVLLESLPYLVAGALLAPFLGRHARHLIALAGCGCGDSPGALSIPAAIATALLFGPWIAIVRFAAGALLHARSTHSSHAHRVSLVDELQRLAPSAALCAIVVTLLPRVDLSHVPAFALFLGGAVVGAFATPCALGGIALAASLHTHTPSAAYGVLCSSGIFSVVTLRCSLFVILRWNAKHSLEGRAPYIVLALSCALVAWQHGAGLIHPRMTIPLAAAAVVCTILAFRSQANLSLTNAMLPLAILAAIIIGAPTPAYTANENTMSDLYPGERLSFTGAYTHGALVRYAITCCRADAAPVAIRLTHSPHVGDNVWLHASGLIVRSGSTFALDANSIDRIAPPSDPFLYR